MSAQRSVEHTWEDVHNDLERNHFAGSYGADNTAYFALAEVRDQVKLSDYHCKRAEYETVSDELTKHLALPKTREQWKKIVTVDPSGFTATTPTMSGTKCKMHVPELMPTLTRDGIVVNSDGSINTFKVGIHQVWNLPGIAQRLDLSEEDIRESLSSWTHNEQLVLRNEDGQFIYNTYAPPVGGMTAYIIGDIAKLSQEDTEITVRVHDECCGSDVFSTDICTCRPYLMYALERCAETAQRGGVGIVVYYRKEGRALGEVLKFRVYNLRKNQPGGDRSEEYFTCTEQIAGIRDARFQPLMPDILLWLGIDRIDTLCSMSNEKYEAITRAGIQVLCRRSIPEELVPSGAAVEITAKVASGYHSDSLASGKIIEYLNTPQAVREQCQRVFELAKEGKLFHFDVHLDQLNNAAQRTVDCIRAHYPELDIPHHARFRHFGGDRLANLENEWTKSSVSPIEKARRFVDLTFVSVLLDAGAGASWKYTSNGIVTTRSEGLAIASYDMFCDGKLSSDPAQPHRVNSYSLKKLTMEDLKLAFQVSASNPLLGVAGRVDLLRNLGEALEAPANAEYFRRGELCRPGFLVDYMLSKAQTDEDGQTHLQMMDLWHVVLKGLSHVWPASDSGVRRGDCWSHSLLRKTGEPGSDMVPFHKLSQWLMYSLVEPLEMLPNTCVDDIDLLTPLAEYRNAGLLTDTGVVVPKPHLHARPYPVQSEVVVEWRALTIVLIEQVADLVRKALGKSEKELPLSRILEGGTWRAGRELAFSLREDGRPPIQIRSDGNVF
ncbi:MAG: hypothetical protein MHM6MM_001136 [Cercozoa sp. M6MM]